MSQFHTISHDLAHPVDKFLQAVVTAERRLTAIAVSFPAHMVQDKILSGLSSAYSPIVTHLQLESPQHDIPAMVNAINTWERADLQRADSVIKAVTEFGWTNTKNRTDVCYRCGLPGHFEQYCVSTMPEVRRRIIRSRERAQFAKDESSDSDTDAAHVAATAFTTNSHIAAAAVDFPFEINIDTIDPTIRESVFSALSVPYPPPSPLADQSPTPTSPTLAASTSSIAGTPKKEEEEEETPPS
ncbi:hypothetical protein B0H13DRAFT_2305466 [Mycena leptocephala]|nr:hypothetical protein B0H13DRAFT_2305466 [Mycena leptocephala]